METSGTKSFNVRWNNHVNNIQSLFKCLFDDPIFVDVTIACQDGLLKAHKLVLSASSPYFEMVFRDNPCKHPTVIMRDVTMSEMHQLCQYMYVGSVDVQENCLNSFLKVGRELQIKGLSNNTVSNNQKKSVPLLFNDMPVKSENSEQNTDIMDNGGLGDAAYSSGNNTSFDNSSILSSQVTMNENVNENNKVMALMSQLKYQTDLECQMCQRSFVSNQNLRRHMQSHTDIMDNGGLGDAAYSSGNNTSFDNSSILSSQVTMNENVNENNKVMALVSQLKYQTDFECQMCQRSFVSNQNLRRHMQSHFGWKPHQCTYCNKSFFSLSHLKRHHLIHTGERPFKCTECPKTFARSDKLRNHILKKHPSGVQKPKQIGRPKKYDPSSINVSTTIASNIQNLNTEQNIPALVQLLKDPLNLVH